VLQRAVYIAIAALSAGLAGCRAEFGPRAKYGITFYAPGVANMDLGDVGLREGLEKAGYRGEVARLTWSYSMNPVIDQTVRAFARLGGNRLARFIKQYQDEHPGGEVNLVGLSAGTGVVIWALEDLGEFGATYQVDNVVLLSSSLSTDYDVAKALEHVKGKIYCYYSPTDAVLTVAMKPFGTIDGKLLVEAAGAVGLRSPNGGARIVDIAWREEFQALGYYGGHFDSTSPGFIEKYVAQHIVSPTPGATSETARASERETALPVAHQD